MSILFNSREENRKNNILILFYFYIYCIRDYDKMKYVKRIFFISLLDILSERVNFFHLLVNVSYDFRVLYVAQQYSKSVCVADDGDGAAGRLGVLVGV